MKVAAYQAPLSACGSTKEALNLIRERIAFCEAEGVEILCCPEGILGGLADYAANPKETAINVENGQLESILAPLASETVTTIIGFTEIDSDGQLFNSAAVYHRGSVTGVYRKLYTAIHSSVYTPGDRVPVFKAGELVFGIIICLDSNYFEPARIMAAQGAVALFVPTNNGLPPEKTYPELVVEARNLDIARAVENSVYVIRADVVGNAANLISYGSTGIVDRDGMVIGSAKQHCVDTVVAEIKTTPRKLRRGWDASKNRAVMDEYVRLLKQDHV